MKTEISTKSKIQIQQLETENEQLKQEMAEIERCLKQKDEDLKSFQNMKEKDEALTLQKI